MEGLAASGGYYTSVACDEIMAQPTTLTGSIGVIMQYLVVKDMLEGKLGVEPVVVKSGERKDWPSWFRKPSEEEMQYLDERIIQPAYERFVEVVDEGRESLTVEEVRAIADGQIFTAKGAVDANLIDSVGYLDDAIARMKELAGVKEAQVVEYKKPFSWARLLEAERGFKFDKWMLYEQAAPEVMYLWTGR
jgi:protease-4